MEREEEHGRVDSLSLRFGGKRLDHLKEVEGAGRLAKGWEGEGREGEGEVDDEGKELQRASQMRFYQILPSPDLLAPKKCMRRCRF